MIGQRLSIRTRLTLWYSGILALTMTVLGLALWFGVQLAMQHEIDRELTSRSQRLQALLDGMPATQVAEEMEEQALATSGTELRVVDRAGKLLFATPGAAGWCRWRCSACC